MNHRDKMQSKHHNKILTTLAIAVLMTAMLSVGALWNGVQDACAATTYTGYVAGTQKQATAYELLQKVNTARNNASVANLKWDSILELAAMTRAKEIAIYFDHIRPTGALWYTVCSKVNAENLYVGYLATSAAANSGWMDSDGHRANRLNSAYRSYGAAAFQSRDGFVYWVELFGRTTSADTTSVGTNSYKSQTPVKMSDGYLGLKSTMTTLDRKTVADTNLRVGQDFYLTIRNWNKKFTYSNTMFSAGTFGIGSTAVASVDAKTGKVHCNRAGVTKVTGKVSSLSGLALSRTIVVRPQAVSGLVLTPQSKGVTMKWNSIAGVQGYEVFRCTTATGTFTKVATVAAGTTKYTNVGLATGSTYYYKVRGYVMKSTSTTRYPGYCCKPLAAKVL